MGRPAVRISIYDSFCKLYRCAFCLRAAERLFIGTPR